MKRILFVDDEPDLMELVVKLLSAHGFSVIQATTGRMGLEMAKTEHPDIILLDVMMDDLDGWEVARKLKAQKSTKNIPIVMFTVMAEDKYRKRSFEYADADWHISKPFESDILFEILNLATGKKEELGQRIKSAIERDENMGKLLEMINPKLLS
jgi:DNA-binding response OmpR family regulator